MCAMVSLTRTHYEHISRINVGRFADIVAFKLFNFWLVANFLNPSAIDLIQSEGRTRNRRRAHGIDSKHCQTLARLLLSNLWITTMTTFIYLYDLHIYLNGALFFHAQTLNAKRILVHFDDFTVEKEYIFIFRIIYRRPFCEWWDLH